MKLVSTAARVVRPAFLIVCVAAGMGTLPAVAQTKPAGVPVPEDSPLFIAFRQLEKQPGYRMTITAQSNDPRMAQMAAMGMGFSPIEMVVRGGAREVTMHMKMPAMDKPGTIDDWEIRSVVQNGRGARLITSPAVARIMKLNEQLLAMQMAMLDQQAGVAMAHAAAEGPIGAFTAGSIAAQTLVAHIEAPRLLKKEKEFFSWKCMPELGGGPDAAQKENQMTDVRLLGEQSLGGRSATAYEFYVRDGDRFQGPLHVLVAKDTGLPLRMDMADPQGLGSMHMDYSFDGITDIEIPSCMAGAR